MLVWRMPHTTADIVLTGDERSALESLARTGRGRADLARRARIILRLAAGDLYSNFNESSRTIAKWKQRFLEARIAGLDGRYPGSTATVLTPQLEARILAKTREQPPDGSTQWSTRSLANALKLKTHTYVQRTWERAGLKPHRIERYMRSTDPEFETKAADVIGLYMAPPQHAAVFCLDEKTAIQALDRVDPVLPLSPGRAERHGFEYRRHGTLSLYAALNTQSGDIIGQTAARHTTDDFLTFLREVVATQPADRALHFILDNLATHKTQQVRTFLAEHPHVHFHFTPTYSSWLNQIELWFAKIERDILARGIFTSVADLRRKIMKYIRHYNKTAKPVRWTYADPRRRIA
jgi:transposase